MVATNENDILFDDFLIISKLLNSNNLINLSSSNDCDCTNYTSTPTEDDFNTHQIFPSSGQTS